LIDAIRIALIVLFILPIAPMILGTFFKRFWTRTPGADWLTGDAADNSISGEAGNDTLIGGVDTRIRLCDAGLALVAEIDAGSSSGEYSFFEIHSAHHRNLFH